MFRYGKFTLANLSLRKEIWEFANGSSIGLKLDVNNLFDEKYSLVQWSSPAYEATLSPANPSAVPYAQGRNFYLAVTYSF
jgi:outer membrane receptor protein involved in Fe transport